MGRLNIKVLTCSLGIFAEFSYLICVLYGLIVPETMHMTQFLEIALPGFAWLTVSGVVIGAVQSSSLWGLCRPCLHAHLQLRRQEGGSPESWRTDQDVWMPSRWAMSFPRIGPMVLSAPSLMNSRPRAMRTC